MTIEQIISLTQAGFSKYDIIEMVYQNHMQMQTSTQQMQTQPSTQQMQMQPSTQQMQMQTSTQQMPIQQMRMNTGFYSNSNYPQNINPQISEQNDIMNELRNLTRSVQSNNVNMMQNQMPRQVTTEDAIASIINPPNYEGLNDGGVK